MRKLEYGHGNAIMILVGAELGLSPSLVDEATRTLNGEAVHVMTGAAIETEAVRINDLVRYDPKTLAQANALAEQMKAQYGFQTAV